LIGAESEVSLSEPETLLGSAKALAEPARIAMGNAEAIANRHSQGVVLSSVCSLNGFEEQIEPFIDSSSARPKLAEGMQDLAENVRIAAPSREIPPFLEERGSLVLGIT
jgi:hypothetical protein